MADQPVIAFFDEGLGNSSYLVGLGEGGALAVDPLRDPGPYLAEAERRGWQIRWAADTHLHADFVSGSRELAAQGAQLLAPARGELEFPHQGIEPGEQLDLGGLTLRASGTPGHTPEHLAYLLADGDHPLGLFSGGSLLAGSVARTDLIAPDQTERLARSQYHSIRSLAQLPEQLVVYPTHGAGSFCSTAGSGDRTTTIGRELTANPLLALDEDAFVAGLLDGLGSYPPYFLRLREVNRRGPRLYGPRPPELGELDVDRVRELIAEGAELIDVRPRADFAAGHVPGALSIPLRPAFATWLGWLVRPERGVVFIVAEDQDRQQLVGECLKIGYEQLAGALAGGVQAWQAAGLELASTSSVPAEAVGAGPVVDVRQAEEFATGHIPDAINVELGSLAGAAEALPKGLLTVHCRSGDRAMTAASLLERAGRRELAVMEGGADAWSAATGRPLAR